MDNSVVGFVLLGSVSFFLFLVPFPRILLSLLFVDIVLIPGIDLSESADRGELD